MADITQIILNEHAWFRRAFAQLDEASNDQIAALWRRLEGRLELHARAEEILFYPELLDAGDDAEEETDDAIGDHNEIREANARARSETVGSEPWWSAVTDARVANSDHMGEEERGALADFRRNTDPGHRAELGRSFVAFLAEHTVIDIDLIRKGPDPDTYIDEHSS